MTQWIAFLKKEFLEQVRTGKMLILAILFILFGIMNPAAAKLTPWLMELMSDQLADSGMSITNIEVNALSSWTQFFKNMPTQLIIFIVMFGSILTAEYQRGTLINVVTKGLSRWKILTSKLTVMVTFFSCGCLLTYGITYGYNAYFWDNSIVHNLFFSAFGFYLVGLWLLTIVLLASAIFKSTAAVVLSTGAAYLISSLLSVLPALKDFLPTHLLESVPLLNGTVPPSDYFAGIAVLFVLIALNIISSVFFFNKTTI